MRRSKYSDEQILAIVKEGEAGRKVSDLCRRHGISEQTYYRWKAKYGGMELSEMQRLKQLEDENRRLKQIVADQTLDIQAIKEVVEKRGRPHRPSGGGGVADASRDESAAGVSARRPEHLDLALSAAGERTSCVRPGAAPGARGGAAAVRVPPAADSPGARGARREPQAPVSPLPDR